MREVNSYKIRWAVQSTPKSAIELHKILIIHNTLSEYEANLLESLGLAHKFTKSNVHMEQVLLCFNMPFDQPKHMV